MSVFRRVPAIRNARKPCGLKCKQVREKVSSSGRFDYSFIVDVEGDNGETFTQTLRWVMSVRSPKPHNWSMALLLNNGRIDCIDFEAVVADHRGHKCSGWHRHIWDASTESCETSKECLEPFGEHRTVEEFVNDCCKVLGIVLLDTEEVEYAQFGLQFS